MKESIRISHEMPEPQAYIDLRIEGGMSKKSFDGAKTGLKNSIFSTALYDNETLIGFGRIIGDGGTVYQIVDVVVKPSYQGKGLGKKIMHSLVDYLEKNAHLYSYISLIGKIPIGVKLYEQFGFKDVGNHESLGMYRWMGNN